MDCDSFLILFIAFLALMGICPMLLRKFSIPQVISLLIVGMLAGPGCLNVIPTVSGWLGFLGGDPARTASHFQSLVDSLGSLGLVLLMALAGMEADFKLISSARRPMTYLSIFTFVIPAAAGYFIYDWLRPDDLPGRLLFASLFASHSVGIVFPVIKDLKISQTKFGAAVLISTVITDISSIILLAVSVQLKRIELGAMSDSVMGHSLSIFNYIDPSDFGNFFTPFFLLIVLFYLFAAVFIVYRCGRWVMSVFRPEEDMLITILLLVILVTVLIGEFLGINLVVGAFIAGLALSRLVRLGNVIKRFESIGFGLVIPFLFVSIGMQTDFKAFTAPGNIVIVLATVGGLVTSKVLSGWLAMRCSGFGNAQGLCAGIMTVPQLSATLAAAAIGKNLGMLDGQLFNAVIILSIVTTLPVPTLVRVVINKFSINFDSESETKRHYPLPNVVKEDDLL